MLPSASRGMEDCHHWPEVGLDESVLVGIDEYDLNMEKIVDDFEGEDKIGRGYCSVNRCEMLFDYIEEYRGRSQLVKRRTQRTCKIEGRYEQH